MNERGKMQSSFAGFIIKGTQSIFQKNISKSDFDIISPAFYNETGN